VKQYERKYFAEVRKLGLTPSNVPSVYIGCDELTYNVPDPAGRTPEQLAEIIEKLRRNLGVGTGTD